jgi:hypothetical protein
MFAWLNNVLIGPSMAPRTSVSRYGPSSIGLDYIIWPSSTAS